MAHSKILLSRPGNSKAVPIGFSWTTLFFGFFTPLSRGDFLHGFILFCLALPTALLIDVIYAFIYNKIYVKKLIGQGYKFESVIEGRQKNEIAKSLGISF